MFVAEKNGFYQILNEYSTCEEIIESTEEILSTLKILPIQNKENMFTRNYINCKITDHFNTINI